MERIYLNPDKKQTTFMKLARKLGADYVENDYMVFKGEDEVAISLDESKSIRIGRINESCDNFEKFTHCRGLNKEEVEWIINKLTELNIEIKLREKLK